MYDYRFYKRCFESRRVCVLMTSLYQSKVACVVPTKMDVIFRDAMKEESHIFDGQRS